VALNFSRKRYLLLKQLVYKLDGGICHICHKNVDFRKAVLDHIIPVAIAGRDNSIASSDYWNLRVAHKRCNCQRSNGKIAGQIRLPLPLMEGGNAK